MCMCAQAVMTCVCVRVPMLSDGAKLCKQANNLQDGINGDDKEADTGVTSVAIPLFFDVGVFAVIMSRRNPSKGSTTDEAVERVALKPVKMRRGMPGKEERGWRWIRGSNILYV